METANIRHYLDSHGGLTAWIHGTNLYGYAYPSSNLAERAKHQPGRDAAVRDLLDSVIDALPNYVVICGYERMREGFRNRMTAVKDDISNRWDDPTARRLLAQLPA